MSILSHFHEPETVNYDNMVNRLLDQFPCLDIKAFAERIGMHWTKLARCRYGVWDAPPEAVKRIREGMAALGREMATVSPSPGATR